jgi:hypothetical protein
MEVARERVEVVSKVRELTLDDCIEIAGAVGREMRRSKDAAMPSSMRQC